MKHLMDTGDIDAATDVADLIREQDPEALPDDYDPADHVEEGDSEGDNETETEPSEFQRRLDAGESLMDIIMSILNKK